MRRNAHLPYNKLKGFLRENGLTYADIAEILGITETAVGLKINGGSDFYISEIDKLEMAYSIKFDFF